MEEQSAVREEIISICKSHVHANEIPQHFEFVDQLPLTTLGKIDYRMLEVEANR